MFDLFIFYKYAPFCWSKYIHKVHVSCIGKFLDFYLSWVRVLCSPFPLFSKKSLLVLLIGSNVLVLQAEVAVLATVLDRVWINPRSCLVPVPAKLLLNVVVFWWLSRNFVTCLRLLQLQRLLFQDDPTLGVKVKLIQNTLLSFG